MDETPRLAADRMLLRLARWLRLLGADVIADPSLTGAGLLKIARAQDRILLTRDKRLRTSPHIFFVESNAIRSQLREAVRRFGLDPRSIALTRCSRCNRPLTPVARELLSRRVPPYVFASHDRFAECEECGRIYWPATHPVRMHAMLDSI
ncbi:MAG: Mut7-C RNAse domain-containing protein [Candidatus Binatus sp.]